MQSERKPDTLAKEPPAPHSVLRIWIICTVGGIYMHIYMHIHMHIYMHNYMHIYMTPPFRAAPTVSPLRHSVGTAPAFQTI